LFKFVSTTVFHYFGKEEPKFFMCNPLIVQTSKHCLLSKGIA